MWTVSNTLLMLAYSVHWYLYHANKERTITPRRKINGFFDQGAETRRTDFHRPPDNPLVRASRKAAARLLAHITLIIETLILSQLQKYALL